MKINVLGSGNTLISSVSQAAGTLKNKGMTVVEAKALAKETSRTINNKGKKRKNKRHYL